MSKRTVFTIVLLIGVYIVLQAVADIGATKRVEIAGVALPGGVFVFAVTFTLRDMIHKRLGKVWAQAAIITAALMNVFQSLYLYWVASLPSPSFFTGAEAWGNVFSIVPAITIGSIAAELTSEMIDTEIYHAWSKRFPTLPQWTRVLASNVIALPLDSLVFGLMAFTILPGLFGAEAVPATVALSIVSGQILYKTAITLLSLPGIYLVKNKPIV